MGILSVDKFRKYGYFRCPKCEIHGGDYFLDINPKCPDCDIPYILLKVTSKTPKNINSKNTEFHKSRISLIELICSECQCEFYLKKSIRNPYCPSCGRKSL